MTAEKEFTPVAPETDVERLSEELRDQVRKAKDRLSERYHRLVEERPFGKPSKGKA